MIEVSQLSKSFKLYARPVDRLKEILLRRSYHHRYTALKDISFRVESGETLGILGQNGAGKSTLLKILNGVILPDSGEVSLNGRVTGLLELGTGFDPALTGRQNIRVNGLLIGMALEEIRAREMSIIAFSELGEFIDEPLRTYSSGMSMRLAFSIAIHADPRCFLVDEALSVGDGHFQQKCMKRIKDFRAAGGSIIFVSHDLNAVKMVCDRALVLDRGEIVFEGPAEGAVNVYNKIMARLDGQEAVLSRLTQSDREYGTREASIVAARFEGVRSGSRVVCSGEQATLTVTCAAECELSGVSLGFMIRDRFGQDIFGTNTHLLGHDIALEPGKQTDVCFRLPVQLAAGKYTVTLALHQDDHHLETCYHWCDNFLQFEVAGSEYGPFSGVVYLPVELAENQRTVVNETATEH